VRHLPETADVYDITVDEHHNFLLSAGVFVHNSIDGDPPAAMRYCLAGDSLVVTGRGLVPIARLSDGAEEIASRVLSAGGRVNTASRWFDCGPFPTWRVSTRRGYEVTGTANHPLLVCVPGEEKRVELVWKRVDQLQVGDWLVLDRSEGFWPEEPVDLREHHPVFAAASRTERHPLPERLNEDLALLLGALVAEGTFRPNVVEFGNCEGEFADVFAETWGRIFPTCRLHTFHRAPYSYGKKPWRQMQVVSLQMIAFLRNLGLSGRSAEREVPDVVLRSPRDVAAAFLRGLYEGDGAVERCGRSVLRVALCAKNRAILRQVQTLLLRFGIAATLNEEKERGTWRLLILGQENLQRFADGIGFVSATKREALADALSRHSGRALSRSDFVPYLADYGRAHATRHREWLSKHNFDRTARLTAALPRLQDALPTDEYQPIEELARARYLFEPVVAIEDAGEQPVYSVRVDSPCHSFVANGFVNHNTEVRMSALAMEMLADIDKNAAGAVPEPARERLLGDRGRDGDEHPAAQSLRAGGRDHPLDRQAAGHGR
jgi:DNA gyrase subunit A